MKKVILAVALMFLANVSFSQIIQNPSIRTSVNGGARILSGQGNTANNPAFGFTGNSGFPNNLNDGGGGNGIFRPLANTMAFSTGSIERLRITSGGAVGIGTTSPNSLLQVNNDNSFSNITVSTNSAFVELGIAQANGHYNVRPGDAFLRTNSGNTTLKNYRGNLYINTGGFSTVNRPNGRSIVLGTQNRNVLSVSDVGRVGIGLDNYNSPIETVTMPEVLLHVNSRNKADIRFENLPTEKCGYVLIIDDLGNIYKSSKKECFEK